MVWEYPKFNIPSNLLEVTDEMLSQWEKENNECDDFNKTIKKDLIKLKEGIISDAKIIWGKNSNVVKYIQRQQIYTPELRSINIIKSRVMKAREDEKKKLHDLERRQKHFELCGKAIKFLTDRNKIINIDFNIDTAIQIANEIAFIEVVSKKQEELLKTSSFIEFNGDENCENCKGWDGSSHRCECGNRRVHWEGYDSDDFFLDLIIYGVAY